MLKMEKIRNYFFLIFSIVIDFLLHYYIKHSSTVLMLKHLSNCL